MEGMLSNSSVVTIHLDNFDNKSASLNAGDTSEEAMSRHDAKTEWIKKSEYHMRNSPEPSTSLSHSPPLVCGSGRFQISQNSNS